MVSSINIFWSLLLWTNATWCGMKILSTIYRSIRAYLLAHCHVQLSGRRLITLWQTHYHSNHVMWCSRCHITRFNQHKRLGTTADRHTVSRLTYNMSIDMQYVDQHTHHVCRSRYCMSVNIQYVDRHICIDVSRSTYSMSIEVLYVDRQLFPADKCVSTTNR